MFQPSAQALILKGSEQESLITEAHRLGSALICADPGPGRQPCGLCVRCRQVASGTYPYWFEIAPQGAANLIRISQIRELQLALMTRASQGQARIVVFLDAHRMREESQNCLLKTLEEPPEDTLLLLLTGRPQDLLPTVRSRCKVLAFCCETPAPAQNELDLAADVIKTVQAKGYYSVFEKAVFVEGSRKKALPDFLGAMERLLRDGLLESVSRADKEAGAALIEALDQVWKAGYLLERNVNPLLILENLFLKIKKLDIRIF